METRIVGTYVMWGEGVGTAVVGSKVIGTSDSVLENEVARRLE